VTQGSGALLALRSAAMTRLFALLPAAISIAGCAATPGPIAGTELGLQSPIPDARLAAIKAALPKVAWPRLQALFGDPDTFFYDHQSMQPSYQETGSPGGGARDNAHWRDLIADTGTTDPNTNPAVGADKVYDNVAKRWRFPVATTAGTDDSTNLVLVEFLKLPRDAKGTLQSIPISTGMDQLHLWWTWQFPNQTMLGEVLFISDGNNLLPCEVRVRTRYPGGWAVNAFRPFPEASALSAAIKTARPNWASNAQLAQVVQQLDGPAALTDTHLTATGLVGTFDQDGAIDVLPDFGDPDLVRQLLTTTTFVSAYGATWRQSGAQTAYAASTASALSIVPVHYTAGIIEVRESSCVRCHQETAKELEQWYPGLTLYGQVWGTDQVFTFHPFDESYYPQLDLDQGSGVKDNRHMNPTLQAMGMIANYDPAIHSGAFYDRH
jgi:hypothetical protein